jgi:hypothetical protein
VKFARANSPSLKKLIFRMADRGKSIKKQRIRPMKMVTVGTTKRSISIRAAETWYCKVVSVVDEEVVIFLSWPVEPVEPVGPVKKGKCLILFFNKTTRKRANGQQDRALNLF